MRSFRGIDAWIGLLAVVWVVAGCAAEGGDDDAVQDDDTSSDDDTPGDDDTNADDDVVDDDVADDDVADDDAGDDDTADAGTLHLVMSSWSYPLPDIVDGANSVSSMGAIVVPGDPTTVQVEWMLNWDDEDHALVCGWSQVGTMSATVPTHPLATAQWEGSAVLDNDSCPPVEEGDGWDSALALVPYAAAFPELGPLVGMDDEELQEAADYMVMWLEVHGMEVEQTGEVAYMSTGEIPFLALGIVYEVVEE